MAVHVLYKFMYISLPSSAKQQLTRNDKILVSLTRANFLTFYFKFIAVSQIHFRDRFDSD